MMNNKINLQKFCAADGASIYDINKPWVLEQRRYATDTRIVVRIPAPGEPDTSGKFPMVSKLPWSETHDWHPMERVRVMEKVAHCHACMIQCPECGGVGVCQHDDGAEVAACLRCAGVGEMLLPTCPVCHETRFLSYLGYGVAIIHPWNHILIASLPAAEWATWPGNEENGIVFRFEGGQGLCAGVNYARVPDRRMP